MKTDEMTIQDITAEYNEIAVEKGLKKVKKFPSKAKAAQRLGEVMFYQPPAAELRHSVRDGSTLGQFRDVLRKGTTMDRLEKIALDINEGESNPNRRVKRVLRQLTVDVGYGLEQRGQKLFLLEAKVA